MSIKVKFFQAGYCTHPEAIVIRDGRWKTTNFPSIFALILHPKFGAILFDTGYSDRFFQETRSFLFRLYAITTPVYLQPEDSAVNQLTKYGVSPESVKYIIISHFHADHIGGLRDFPNAEFICFRSAYEAVKSLRNIAALKAGFLPSLLPTDFEQRVVFVEEQKVRSLPSQYGSFNTGFDLFGDSTLIGVELPGHATGQLGLLFTDVDKQDYFLIADACWLSRAYQDFVRPHPIANLVFSDKRQYMDTLRRIHLLHQLNPTLKIIPTHCTDAWRLLNF